MLGAIAGGMAGSIYENLRTKRKDVKLLGRRARYTLGHSTAAAALVQSPRQRYEATIFFKGMI